MGKKEAIERGKLPVAASGETVLYIDRDIVEILRSDTPDCREKLRAILGENVDTHRIK